MSTTEDLQVESLRVKREMRRLRKLHGTYEKALQIAILERYPLASPEDVERELERLLGAATVALLPRPV